MIEKENPNISPYSLGLFFNECPSFDIPARQERPNNTESPKNTTAFNRTQMVCILAAAIFYLTRLNEMEVLADRVDSLLDCP